MGIRGKPLLLLHKPDLSSENTSRRPERQLGLLQMVCCKGQQQFGHSGLSTRLGQSDAAGYLSIRKNDGSGRTFDAVFILAVARRRGSRVAVRGQRAAGAFGRLFHCFVRGSMGDADPVHIDRLGCVRRD
jgi:hypothetical protein